MAAVYVKRFWRIPDNRGHRVSGIQPPITPESTAVSLVPLAGSIFVYYRSLNMNPDRVCHGSARDALFTRTQQQVPGLLYGQPQRRFYLKEILHLAEIGVAIIRHELERMRDAGILTMTRIGNQQHKQAKPQCPVYDELHE